MPELPEVETVRRGLESTLVGALLVRVEQRRPDLRFPFPANFAARLKGRTITALSRRAKYLLASLDDGETLIAHLGMSGSFRIEEAIAGDFVHPRGKDAAHDHVVFHLDHGGRVTYNDPRRFGFMDIVGVGEIETHRYFAKLGVEPLSNAFSAQELARLFAGKTAPLKAALLDQSLIAGLGNIYVCEALFRAGLDPAKPAAAIVRKDGGPTAKGERLARAISEVLNEAIAAGGSSLRDHRQADGSLGYFQHNFKVYGRAGEPCVKPGCKGIVQRRSQSGRSTFFCALCQT